MSPSSSFVKLVFFTNTNRGSIINQIYWNFSKCSKHRKILRLKIKIKFRFEIQRNHNKTIIYTVYPYHFDSYLIYIHIITINCHMIFGLCFFATHNNALLFTYLAISRDSSKISNASLHHLFIIKNIILFFVIIAPQLACVITHNNHAI